MKLFILIPSLMLGVSVAAIAAEGSFDRSLSVSGPVNLDVRSDSGGIVVTSGSSGSVRVHAVLKANNWHNMDDVQSRIRRLEDHPPIEQDGNHIRIGYADRALLRGISMHFEIETPVETELKAEADSGGIRVNGINGPLNCKADSGGIEVRDASADVHASADSGGIHIHHVQGAVTARADSGGIQATEIAGAIDASADSGHLELSQTSAAPIRARADSGGISVKLASGAGYDVRADADSGGISVARVNAVNSNRHHLEGKIGSGGPLVSVSTDSGGISID